MNAQLLKEKREKRAELKAAADQLFAKVEARTWNETTDKPALDNLETELNTLTSEIETLERQVDMTARAATWTANSTTASPVSVNVVSENRRGDSKDKAAKEFRLLKAIHEQYTTGRLSGIEAEMAQEAQNESRSSGAKLVGQIQMPNWLVLAGSSLSEKRDMTAGTTTAGGFTVQTDIGPLIPLLDPRPIVRRAGATFMTGMTGNVDFPRNDAGAVAAWETEQGAANVTNPTFDRVQMSPNRLAAYTDVSRQIMIQSTIDMENFVRNRLNQAVSNALDVAAFSGNGGNIAGLNSEAGVNAVSFLSSPTWAKIVQMETEVAADDADFGTLAYIFHPRTAGIMKTQERTSTNGIYLWNGANNGDGQVNGYRALTSTLSYSPATNVYSGYFGNWAKMLIGQWGGLDILVDPYTQATTGTVRIVTNSYWDVAVEHGAAFAIGQNIHTS